MHQRKKKTFGSRLITTVLWTQGVALLILVSFQVLIQIPVRAAQEEMVVLTKTAVYLGTLKDSLLDQETGQRGYDLTGDPVFLAPFTKGSTQFTKSAASAMRSAKSFSLLRPLIATAIQQGQEWHKTFGVPQVRKRREGLHISVQELLAGKTQLDAFRVMVNASAAWIENRITANNLKLHQLTDLLILLSVSTVLITMTAVTLILIRQLRSWLGPLQRLTETVNQYARGDLSCPVPLLADRTQFGDLFVGVDSMRLALRERFDNAEQLALFDALTGIGNRRFFDVNMDRVLQDVKRGGSFCLMMCDIDHFKVLNDRYGHQEGDRVLRGVAKAIEHSLGSEDVLARYGGEEFVILFSGPLPLARQSADAIRRRVQETPLGQPVTISIGVASFHPEDTKATLVTRADQALYTAKNKGRNCVEVA